MAGPWERYAATDGPWSKYGETAVDSEGSKSIATKAGEVVRDLGAGAVRGAASIGATLLTPIDAAARAVGIENSVIGRTDRREATDAALQELGADTSSTAYQAGKIGAEVAGTLGVGGAAANAIARIPGAARVAGPALEAMRTAGMSAGGATGAAGMATRVAGAAATGGLAAGLVNPEDAGTGAAIGAAAPVAVTAAAKTGAAIAKLLRGPAQAPEVAAAVKAARDAGYVIPPTQARPTLGNRIIEGVSGKITTAQNASARNQRVTQAMAAKAINLPPDTPLTPEVLTAVRNTAGQAYDAVSAAGTIQPTAAYGRALDKITEQAVKATEGFPNAAPSPVLRMVETLRSEAFDAGSAVAKIRELRSAADDAFRAGNSDVGRAARAGAKAIEDALEAHLQASGQGGLLRNFREARQLIAKTYSIEKAMTATGTIDARKLAAELKKGKPLTGELRQVAEFGSRFPKAAQTVEQMGSLPQTSPLDFYGAGGLAAMMGDPMALSAVAVRPALRATALSPMVQNRLIQPAPGGSALSRIPFDQAALLGMRAAPVIGPSSSGR